jgi:hypothetical protein
MPSPVMQLQLTRLRDGQVHVQTLRSPKGEPSATVTLPYDCAAQRQAVALALEAITFERLRWEKSSDKFQVLKDLGPF